MPNYHDFPVHIGSSFKFICYKLTVTNYHYCNHPILKDLLYLPVYKSTPHFGAKK